MSHNGCEILVVGGGPAGLAAAIALRQKGADVMVVEALQPPVDKACGEGLMPDSRRDLAALGIELKLTDGPAFNGIRFVNWTDKREVRTKAEFASGRGLGVRRLRLHTLLVARAEELGVQLRWNTRAVLDPGRSVLVEGEPCGHRYLIGADGQRSRVRRWAGLERENLASSRFGFARHYAVAPWSEFVEVHWGRLGQAYITPVGEREVCIAVLTRHFGVLFEQVIADMPFVRERLQAGERCARDRGAMTTTRRLHRVTRGNVALVGDASGSADAVTGEGLALGFRQAMLLADALEQGGLEHYARGHADILRTPQAMARVLLQMDGRAWLRNRAMRVLAAEPQLFRRLLDVHLGEEPLNRFLLRHGAGLGWRLLAPTRFPLEGISDYHSQAIL